MNTEQLVLSANQLPGGLPCGSCTLFPDLATGFVLGVGNTDAQGNAALAFAIPPIPGLVGLDLYGQWLVATASPSCLVADFSNALKIELQ